MKLSVFCSDEKKMELPKLRIALDDFFIEYQTILFNENDSLENMIQPLNQVLNSTSFYMLIPTTEDFSSQWVSYIAGFNRMKKENVIILYHDGTPPGWLKDFNSASDIQTLVSIIKDQIPGWNLQIKKSQAMNTLKDRMREHTHQNFFHAVNEGDRFLTGVFLDAGFEVNKLSTDQVSLLGAAARQGHTHIVKILHAAGADINLISLDRNNTPLMDAASGGHLELVRFFLDHGAELEIKSKSGQTALILAAGNGQIDCAEMLIKAGADCDNKDSMGLSARKYAQLYQIEELLSVMPPLLNKD